MKVKIALFQTEYGSLTTLNIRDDGTCWGDTEAGYVRISGDTEVEFDELPREKIVESRLKSLDAQEKKIVAEFSRAIDELADQRAKLLALPAPQQEAAE